MSNTISLEKIEELSLSSPSIGNDINDRFKGIDSNFQKIIQAEYLKGEKGASIKTKVIDLSTEEEIRNIFLNIITNDDSKVDPEVENVLKESKVIVICNDEDEVISSLPFVFLDPNIKNLNSIEKPDSFIDRSCIIYYDINAENTKKWISSKTIPTIYYDSNKGQFCWSINGCETDLLAQGPQGKAGEAGTGLLLATIENNNPQNPQRKISQFYYSKGNSTEKFWYDPGNFPEPDLLKENALVLALAKNEKHDSIKSGENGTEVSCDKLYLGGLIIADGPDGKNYSVNCIDDISNAILNTSSYVPLNDFKEYQTELNETTIPELNNSINANKKDIDVLKETTDDLSNSVNANKNDISELNKTTKDLSNSVNANKNDISELKGQTLDILIDPSDKITDDKITLELQKVTYISNTNDKTEYTVILPGLPNNYNPTTGNKIYQCCLNIKKSIAIKFAENSNDTTISGIYLNDNVISEDTGTSINPNDESRREYICTGYVLTDPQVGIAWYVASVDYELQTQLNNQIPTT